MVVKSIVRLLVVGGTVATVVGVPAVLVAGPDRVAALFTQAQDSINEKIDQAVGDPVAIRAQLRDLEAEYPERIAAVRADLSELEHQIGQIERELAVSERVVSLADEDLGQLRGLLTKAQERQSDAGGFAVVRVRFDDRSLSLDEAYANANEISSLRSAYATRAADLERDRSLLAAQHERLAQVLSQLETERANFQAQLWQLDRQVDAIARNDRMIDLLEARNEHIEELDRYEAKTLDHVTAKITKKLAEQEGRIATLTTSSTTEQYLGRAKAELDLTVRAGQELRQGVTRGVIELETPVIEIGPDRESVSDAPGEPVASNTR